MDDFKTPLSGEPDGPSHGLYGSLLNDWMFKRLFGSEDTKDILISFLNHIMGDGNIEDVAFQNVEHLGPTQDDRKAIFDVCVRTTTGEEYIVEMQLARQRFFRDRALYYLAYPILNQGAIAKAEYRQKHGEDKSFNWSYQLKPVRLIAILNFSMNHSPEWDADRYHSSYRLHEDATGELLYDKLQLIFLELHRFDKTEEELVTWYDKWMYLFKNMAKLNARPVSFQEKIFDRLFDKAKIANLAPNEYRAYQKSENMGYSYQNTIDYAREEGEKVGEKRGREIGRAEGRAEGINEGRSEEKTAIARNMLTKGYDLKTVSELTGLSTDEVLALK